MAKSLSAILNQIERLQKEAATIQLEVIARVRKEIEEYGLTVDQLFGSTAGRAGAKPSKAVRKKPAAVAKYADGAGNTWGGRGKRPDWLRQALAQGKALEDFLAPAAAEPAGATSVPKRKAKAASVKPSTKAAKKRPTTKRTPVKRTRAKGASKAPAA